MMMWTASPFGVKAPRGSVSGHGEEKPSMKEFIRIGVDLSKGFFQVHALEREGIACGEAEAEPGEVPGLLRRDRAVSDRHGGLRIGASLGAQVASDGP